MDMGKGESVTGRIVVEDVTPSVHNGEHPAKAVAGERVPVRATVWRDGPAPVSAAVSWRCAGDEEPRETPMTATDPGLDEFSATICPDAVGRCRFAVVAWGDPWRAWCDTITVKLAAEVPGRDLANDLEVGARLLDRIVAGSVVGIERDVLVGAAAALRDPARTLEERVAPALSEPLTTWLAQHPVRDLLVRGPELELWVERPVARFGAWYELFPRSTGGWDAAGRPAPGTFATAARQLDRIAGMGFDILYLPPIHPIGEVNRKGANNSTRATAFDVGSPWAIGSRHGGHDAIHPALGDEADFVTFVGRARDLGLEVALDLALQCAPDHPWVHEHPEWFTTLPDGSIAHAENPPKRYEDIYPINFDDAPDSLFAEILRVVRHWIDLGVHVFRVDNPHTKPPDFWDRLLWTIRRSHPEVVFLAEAFTRPAVLFGLARLGFSQSYTYFTWRDGKRELTEFGRDLVAHADEARPNLFVNTPDILAGSLRSGDPHSFAMRATLAATLSPSWGVYAGFELFEHVPVRAGSEEYLDSEKYQLRPRDYPAALARGRSLEPWLRRLNEIRRAHPALRELRTLRFHPVDHDSLLCYSKTDARGRDAVVVVVNLDPTRQAAGTVHLDRAALGLGQDQPCTVRDEVTGKRLDWGRDPQVRLTPRRSALIASVVRS
jgi:starch synthase (maltosyl-transferring)